MRMLLMALQAATPAAPLPPIDFDLAEVARRPRKCSDASPNEIVVCGRRREDRLKPIPGAAELDRPENMDLDLPGGWKGKARMEGGSVGGFPSNRVMIKIRRPF